MSLRDEVAWWRFYLPRQAVQALARRVDLAALRDRLPRAVGERVRFGLYPARVTEAGAVDGQACAREFSPWGIPAALDPSLPVRFSSPPRASILLVTYGNLALTRLCLASLQRAKIRTPFEIVCVDNASPDESAAHLRAIERGGLLPLTLIESPRNLGFAAGNNLAASRARGEILVLLNNDTVVTDGWLDRLCDHLDHDPRLGLVGPVTNACGNEQELGTPYRDLDGMFAFAAGYTARHEGVLDEPSMITLFCAALPRARWDEAGGLDEGYGRGLFEDDDLSASLRGRGHRLGLARDAFVHHFGGAAFAKLPPRDYLRLFWENRRRYERRWGAWTPR